MIQQFLAILALAMGTAMPGMTIVFAARDKALPDPLKASDQVESRLARTSAA